MMIKRKEFLQSGALATASLMLPQFLKAFERPMSVPRGNKVVVVIQLSGGNDGLNTVIPIANDIYYRARPTLGLRGAQSLKLSDDVALHPALEGFRALYDQGALAILNNVGYPNPDRSHFRSMDIWHSASSSREYWNDGWLGRYLDAQCNACERPTQAIELDDVLSLALKGEKLKGIAVKDPRRLYGTANEKFFRALHTDAHGQEGQPVDYLYKTLSETMHSADYIFSESKARPTKAAYPSTELGKSLRTIASLMYSQINTTVYYVSLGSFDTHANQQAQQQRLLKELNDAVTAFTSDLQHENRFDDLLLFTFSEFGRRVEQNASGGTDHGTANNMFLIGGGLKEKGVLNELPDLANLDEGDLRYKVDFKNVYATILNKWLKVNDQAVLKGRYETMNFI